MIAAHPVCAGRTARDTDGGVSCAAGGHVYVLYVTSDPAAIAAIRELHPTGSVTVDGPRVWVTE
jgi:hypothetical protein